ncbi:MAG: hypothetical protein Q8P31_03965 [Bacillota bacterium]|nr:hypothetical protein [Bacillota bacterium]
MSPMRAIRWWHVLLRWQLRLIARGPGLWLGMIAMAAFGVRVAGQASGPWEQGAAAARWCLVVAPLLLAPSLASVRRRAEAAGMADMVQARPMTAAGHVYAGVAAGTLALILVWGAGAAAAGTYGLLMQGGPALALSAIGVQALLVLPALFLAAALAAVADAAWGRQEPVLVCLATAVLASLLYHPATRLSNLVPLLVPRYISAVFGFGRHAYVVWVNKGWSLGLGLFLAGCAPVVCAARSPLHLCAGERRGAKIVAVCGLTLALACLPPLLAAPAPGRWADESRAWETEQIRQALAGAAGPARLWDRHMFDGGPVAIEVWLARGTGGAQAVAAAAASILPHLLELAPPPADPLVLMEGGSLDAGTMLRPGALALLPKDARLAASGRALRPVLRAMTEAYWNDLFHIGGASLSGSAGISPAVPVALFDQWRVLAQMAPDLLTPELDAWRSMHGTGTPDNPPQSKDPWSSLDELWSSGAAGARIWGDGVRQALNAWDLAQELGTQRVREALGAAARDLAPGATDTPVAWRAYWRRVAELLGVDVSRLGPAGPAGGMEW